MCSSNKRFRLAKDFRTTGPVVTSGNMGDMPAEYRQAG